MNLRPSTTDSIDLTAHLPLLRSSLTPQSSEYSGVNSRLHQVRSQIKQAEEFNAKACAMMAGWIVGTVLLFSVAIIVWAKPWRKDYMETPNAVEVRK